MTKIKRIHFLTLLYAFTALLIAPPADAQSRQNAAPVVQTVESFFSYLKNGSRVQILEILTEPLHTERKELLSRNTRYADFLKKTYKDASMQILKIERIDPTTTRVDVEIKLKADEPASPTSYFLKLVGRTWKISEEKREL